MKKIIKTIFSFKTLLLLGAVALIFIPLVTNAQTGGAVNRAAVSILTDASTSFVYSIMSTAANIALGFTSFLVSIAGSFLSMSINITLNIGYFFSNFDALETVWKLIRNFASIFIIFLLLYASIRTILGDGTGNLKKLVANIIIAGLLINFSLFFTRILIDASNLVSLQFYKAIAPKTELNYDLARLYNDGGLSNVFMDALKIQRVYAQNGILKTGEAKLSIIFAATMGVIIMLTAAFSLFAAAVAFIARAGILLFMMAVSPLYFAAMIYPGLSKKTKEFTDLFKSQLIFMPVYLFLMYVALSFITSSGFQKIFNQTDTLYQSTEKGLGVAFLSIVVYYIIALVFVNIPLLAAIKMGALGASWAPTANTFAGWVGRNTLGRAGKAAGKGFDTFAAKYSDTAVGKIATPILRGTRISQATRGIIANVEKSKYGSKYSLGDIEKEEKDRSKVVSGVSRTIEQKAAINAILKPSGAPPTIDDSKKFREVVGKMTAKEIADMDSKILEDKLFLTRLSSSQFDKITDDKFEGLTDKEKDELKILRKKHYLDTFNNPGLSEDEAKDYVKGLSGKELAKLEPILTNPKVVKGLNTEQLKAMRDLIDDGVKRAIGNQIDALGPGVHKSSGYINNNRGEWT